MSTMLMLRVDVFRVILLVSSALALIVLYVFYFILGKVVLLDTLTVKESKLKNGDMIFINFNMGKTVFHNESNPTAGKIITKDGNIQSKEGESNANGFRPGLLPLRSMKMHWTLTEFVDLDNKFVHKVKRQEEVVCKKVSVDTKCIQDFQEYMRALDYSQIRYQSLLVYNAICV